MNLNPRPPPDRACRTLRGQVVVLFALVIGLSVEPLVANEVGAPLPPWTPGSLDIHQIASGRGNAALIICPDGTNIMIDAGSNSEKLDVSTPARPDDSRRPGEWAGRYAFRHLQPTGRAALDYFVVTHFHPDHLGDINARTPPSRDGSYLLTGISDVAEILPIGTVIDREFPDYTHPTRWNAGFAANYFAYIAARKNAGAATAKIVVGSASQFPLRRAPRDFPAFSLRTIAANGEVWTGSGPATRSVAPPLSTLAPSDYPDENMCSLAMRLSYGKFDYYTGRDLACSTREGTQPWRDVETPVAVATGPVEVAVANHHAYFDAVGIVAAPSLQLLVWVVPASHITHLNIAQLEVMLSERIYPGPRSIFVTDLMPATALGLRRFINKLNTATGHIIVRVAPGGTEFRVFVTNSGDELDTVIAASESHLARCRSRAKANAGRFDAQEFDLKDVPRIRTANARG